MHVDLWSMKETSGLNSGSYYLHNPEERGGGVFFKVIS